MTLNEYIQENEISLNPHQKLVLQKANVLNIPISYIMNFFNTTDEEDIEIIITSPKYNYRLNVVGVRYYETKKDTKKLTLK